MRLTLQAPLSGALRGAGPSRCHAGPLGGGLSGVQAVQPLPGWRRWRCCSRGTGDGWQKLCGRSPQTSKLFAFGWRRLPIRYAAQKRAIDYAPQLTLLQPPCVSHCNAASIALAHRSPSTRTCRATSAPVTVIAKKEIEIHSRVHGPGQPGQSRTRTIL